jgi:hypothetical protein
MKCLYGCLAVASLLLWTDHIAWAQENQYDLPVEIPEDVDGAMAKIGEVLKGMGVETLDSVVVLGLKGNEEPLVAFAIKTKRDAAAAAMPCNVPTGVSCGVDPSSSFPACTAAPPALLIPKCDPATGRLIEWYAGFNDSDPPPAPPNPYKLIYKGSPGTLLHCGNNVGGSRPCK